MVFSFKIIDLTHDIIPNMSYWCGISPFNRVMEFESYDVKTDTVNVHEVPREHKK